LYQDKEIIYIQQKFNDFDHLKESAKRWSLDFKQLDAGKFKGDIMLLDMANIQFARAQFNRKLDQKGSTPKGFRTFGIPADNKQSFTWRNYTINSNHIMIFPNDGELDSHSDPGFRVYTVSISNKLVEQYKQVINYSNLQLLEKDTEVLELNSQSISILRVQLNYLITQVQLHPEIINKKAFQQIFINKVPTLILNNLAYYQSITPIFPKRIRDISLKKAIDYISACTNEYPSVLELCIISGSSQRTLEYAFKEKYGIGPKDYMKKQRLNRVNKALKRSDPDKVKISEVAHQFGFWHMGQFAVDYKRLFYELPSQTLKNI
jgi:AraC family ethanolamine operon transcriptional activator